MKEYCFNAVKDAYTSYNALDDAEKSLVSNYAVLEQKISDLKTLYGKDINFSLTYQENLPVVEEPTDDTPEKKFPWVLVIIIAASVLAAGGAAVVVVIFIKKKGKCDAAQTVTESENDVAAEDVIADTTADDVAFTDENTDAKED